MSESHFPRLQSLLEQAEFWLAEKQFPRAFTLYETAIQQDSGIKARLQYARVLNERGSLREAQEQLLNALEIAKQQEDSHAQAAACEMLAVISRIRNDWNEGRLYQQQAIAAKGKEELTNWVAEDFLAMANDAIVQGHLADAKQLVQLAMNLASEASSWIVQGDGWGTLGAIAWLDRDFRVAWFCFRRAYAFHSLVKDMEGCLLDLLNLAVASQDLGNWDLSKRLLESARKKARDLGKPEMLEKANWLLNRTEKVLSVFDRTPEWN